jgi:hypothetical protein
MFSLNYHGRDTFAEVYLWQNYFAVRGWQERKIMYLCRNLKTNNNGIFLSVDLAPVMIGVSRKSPFPTTYIYEYADENEC